MQNIIEARNTALMSKEAQFIRRLGRKTPHTFELYREFLETRPPIPPIPPRLIAKLPAQAALFGDRLPRIYILCSLLLHVALLFKP